jgi:hypothetical protein
LFKKLFPQRVEVFFGTANITEKRDRNRPGARSASVFPRLFCRRTLRQNRHSPPISSSKLDNPVDANNHFPETKNPNMLKSKWIFIPKEFGTTVAYKGCFRDYSFHLLAAVRNKIFPEGSRFDAKRYAGKGRKI